MDTSQFTSSLVGIAFICISLAWSIAMFCLPFMVWSIRTEMVEANKLLQQIRDNR
jgi:hypothetical protein